MMTTQADLHTRLAARLEPLVEAYRHRTIEPWTREQAASDWADQCLTDAAAALDLLDQYGPKTQPWRLVLSPPGDTYNPYRYGCEIEDEHGACAFEGRSDDACEAMMLAFVVWKDSEESNADDER